MNTVTIWHNPRCSKSRAALELLEERGKEFNIYKYLDENPTADEIIEVLKKLGISPRDLMRTKEEIYAKLNLKDQNDDQKLILAMAENSRLIERPIVVNGERAAIGRPIENIIKILD